MELYYYRDPVGNFGDDMNAWLWPQLFAVPLEACFDDDTLFLGIGSILNHKVPTRPAKKAVFGSGHAYGSIPADMTNWRFSCVRGPLTAKALELPESLAICDGALLVRQLIDPSSSTQYRAAFMPHHQTAKYDAWRPICESLSIRYIDPADPVPETLDAIRQSEVVITEAMHGAIVADALRVPWIPVRTRPRILTFKWQDWASTLDIEHEFEWLPPVWSNEIDLAWKKVLHPTAARVARSRLWWLLRFGRRRLSSDVVFQNVYTRITEAFEQFHEEAVRSGSEVLAGASR